MTEYRITTKDNPFDPFDQYYEWLMYDHVVLKYNTDGLLARFAYTSDALTDKENNDQINEAIFRIMALDPSGLYRRVKREVYRDEEFL